MSIAAEVPQRVDLLAVLTIIVGYRLSQAIPMVSSQISTTGGRYLAARMAINVAADHLAGEKVAVLPLWIASLPEYYGIAHEDIVSGRVALSDLTQNNQPFWILITHHAPTNDPVAHAGLRDYYRTHYTCPMKTNISGETARRFIEFINIYVKHRPEGVQLNTIDEFGNTIVLQCWKGESGQ